MSLNEIVLDIGSNIFEDSMSYVALSRVTTIQGLNIISLNVQKIKPPEDVLLENKRLRKLQSP